MSQKVRVQLSFQKYGDDQLSTVADAVFNGMKGHMVFTKPPVDIAAVQTAREEFSAALAATVHGGPAATATKNTKRAILIDLLLKVGHYVQSHSNNDRDLIISSGFIPLAGRTSVSTVPGKPSITTIVNGNTTELVVKLQRVPGAKFYEVRSAAIDEKGTPGEWKQVGFFSKSSIVVTGLNPGTRYAFQARAMGTVGFGDWSDPVVHVCW